MNPNPRLHELMQAAITRAKVTQGMPTTAGDLLDQIPTYFVTLSHEELLELAGILYETVRQFLRETRRGNQ